MSFIVRGLDRNGGQRFYTGMAGGGWLSDRRSDAFLYASQDLASRKALAFNRMSDLHGLWFIGIPAAVAASATEVSA